MVEVYCDCEDFERLMIPNGDIHTCLKCERRVKVS